MAAKQGHDVTNKDITGGAALFGELVRQVATAGWRICGVLILTDTVVYRLGRGPFLATGGGEDLRTVRGPTAVAALQAFLGSDEMTGDPRTLHSPA